MAETVELAEIIDRADAVLRTALSGLSMMRSENGNTKNVGLRNVLVFGRSVTFVLQNLRGKHPLFDGWYAKQTTEMAKDPVFTFFREARNHLEKKGQLEVATSAVIHSFSSDTMALLEAQKPNGATAFFIGDQLGGSGWEVQLPDGTSQKFYVEPPSDVAVVDQVFSGELAHLYLPSDSRSTLELATYYTDALARIVDDARQVFLDQPASQTQAGVRLPPYLRVVD